MNDKADLPEQIVANRSKSWSRLLGMALLLALCLQFLPWPANSKIRLSFRPASSFETVGLPGAAYELEIPLAIGPALVQATGGLTITKSVSPTSVEHGGLLTYTLTITNGTGGIIRNVQVTDTVPAATTCERVVIPATWLGSEATCQQSGLASWYLLPILDWQMNPGEQQTFTYTVRLDKPLADGSQIVNAAGSYGVVANDGAFTDGGGASIIAPVKAPAWAIHKTAEPAPFVTPGQLLTYTLTVTNVGSWPTDAPYLVTDTLPANTSFVGGNPAPSGPGNGVITWSLTAALDPLESTDLVYTVRLDTPLTNGLDIINDNYGVSGGNTIPDATGLPVTVTVSSGPILNISKVAHSNLVQAGSLLTYTITYSNSGTDSTTGTVWITDTIPPQTSYVSSTPPFDTQVGDKYGWFTPTLSPLAGEQQIILTVRVVDTIADQTLITNSVTITDVGGSSNTAAATETVTIASKPILTVNKLDSADPVAITDPLVYTILITNSGSSTATNIILTDTLDSSTNFGSAFPAPTNNAPPSYGFLLPSIPPDATETVIITTTINPTVQDQDVLVNQVTVTSAETTTVTINEQTTVDAPQLVVVKTAAVPNPPDTVRAGETIAYTIYYTNEGSLPATGIRITDTLPLSVTGVVSNPGSAAVADGALPDLVFSLSSLAADAAGQITIDATIATTPWPVTPVTLLNTVTATHDLDAPPAVGTASIFGEPGLAASVVLEAVPQMAVINTPVVVTATLRDVYNNLIVNGTNVVFSSTLAQSTIPATTTVDGRAVSTLTSPVPGVTSVSVVTPTGLSAITIPVTFVATDLVLTKTVNLADAAPLQTLVYTLTLHNSSGYTATTLISDTLPAGVTFIEADPPPLLQNPFYVFSLGRVPSNTIQTVVITTSIDGDVPDGSKLVNQAIAGAPEAIRPFPTASVTTTVRAPDFAISKNVFPATAVAGETVTYTITFTNSGSLDATSLRITDTLPARIAAANATFDSGLLTQNSNTLPEFVFSAGSPFSGTGVITVTAQLSTTPWPSTPLQLTNRVTATYDINPGPLTAQADISGSSGPPFTLVLTATPSITRINNFIDLTAWITDRYGNPITDGQTIVFSSTLGMDNASSSNGQAATSLTSNTGGEFAVTALVQGTTVSATTVVTFTAPAIAISKTSDRAEAPPGGVVVYTIVVSNTGDSTLDQIVLQDILQDGLIFDSAEPAPANVAGQQVTFNLGSLGTGVVETVVMTVSLSPDLFEGLILANAAQVQTAQTEAVQDEATIVVAASALTIDKQVEPAVVLAGEPLTYTITYANNTDKPITDIRLTDNLPAGLTDVAVSPGGATVALNSGGTIVLTRSQLLTSTSDQIIITARTVTSPWPAAGRTITNVVTATTATQTGQRLANASSEGRPNLPATLVVEADPLFTTVGSNVVVTATLWDQYGNPVYNGTTITFATSLPGTGVDTPVMTVDGMAVATLTSSAIGTTTVQAQFAGLADSVEVQFTERPSYGLYLPVVYKDYAEQTVLQADLVVEAIEVTPANPTTGQPVTIEVTVRNTGIDPVSRFWVDLYLTDTPVTPQVNQPWTDFGPLGVAWIVPDLAAGQSLTLSNLNPNAYSDPTDCNNYSRFTPEQVGLCTWTGNSNHFTTPGTYYVTAQVDSFGEDSSPGNGNITETDETNNTFSTPIVLAVTGAVMEQPALLELPVYKSAVPGSPRPPLQFR